MTPIARKLIEHVANTCAVEPGSISYDSALDEIGLDSLALSLILRAIEIEFALEFEEADVAEFLAALTLNEYAQILTRALERTRLARVHSC